MASISVWVDDELKMRADKALEKLGVTPAELMRQALQYVVKGGHLRFKAMLETDEDEALSAKVHERLTHPRRVTVSLDDL